MFEGVTRGVVIDILRKQSITIIEKRLSLTEFYCADEVFTTGTMGEITPVKDIDGRKIGGVEESISELPITQLVQNEYRSKTQASGLPIPNH